MFSACADDDEIWMPPSADGKADGVQILKGSDVPSQYVDNNKHYLTTRKIDTLEAIGALKDIEDMLAKRADGIIANLPANGRIEAAELVRMESAQIFPTLFPEEKQALPKLWDLLEAPSPNAQAVEVPDPDLQVTEQVTQPGGLTYPTSIQISTLPSDMQSVAKRVQLVFNADNNANTIQIDDIDKVLADPQAFTPAEVTQLHAIKVLFTERATSSEEVKAKVPKPGHNVKTTTFGQMSLELTADVVLHEHRQLYSISSNGTFNLTLEETLNATLHAPAGDKLVLITLDTATETVYDGADVVFGQHPVGNVVLERYTQGVRKETHSLALPTFAAGKQNTDLTGVLDYKLVAGSTTLQKNAVSLTNSGNWQYLDSHYETTLNPNPAISQTSIDQLATKKSALPTGRYEVQSSSGLVAIDLYPEGVVIAHMNTETVRLRPYNGQAQQMHTGTLTNGILIAFYPETNQLTVNGQTSIVSVAQRTK